MRKVVIISSLFLLLLVVLSIASLAKEAFCKYDADFDKDKDYVMNKDADCGADYQYDCDDSDKDEFKGCGSLWNRLVNFFFGDDDNTIGNVVKNVVKGEVKPCAANICMTAKKAEVYCPDNLDECKRKYSSCRVIECEKEPVEVKAKKPVKRPTTVSNCTAVYHDCFDGSEEVTCKGSFSDCSNSFKNCTCGIVEEECDADVAAPDSMTVFNGTCDTNVFVCERQVIAMDGSIADSKVTCKSGFEECARLYGNCVCGNSSLTDFGVKYVGRVNDTRNPNFDDGECTKKVNTCDKGDGIMISCEGSFEFCNKMYDDSCRCGIDSVSSGFMVTEG